jgi:hypothetical protein
MRTGRVRLGRRRVERSKDRLSMFVDGRDVQIGPRRLVGEAASVSTTERAIVCGDVSASRSVSAGAKATLRPLNHSVQSR